MLREAGAFISDGNLKFPARLVEDAIASTPGRLLGCHRLPNAVVGFVLRISRRVVA